MRTTIRLDDQLLQDAKIVAAESGRTLTRVIEDALREALARRRTTGHSERVRLTTFKGTGVQPGVDINNSADLLDILDPPDATFRR